MSEKKLALVTGASRGIGAAIARSPLQSGYEVLGTARTSQSVEAMQKAWQDEFGAGLGFVLDLSSQDSIDALLAYCKEGCGIPSILVCNAGCHDDQLFLRMKFDQWDSVVDANLHGLFRLTKAFVRPMLKKRWGRIVPVTSLVAHTGNAGQVNYAAAKAGMVGLAKSLAQEVAGYGITVNCVAPGFVSTEMAQDVIEKYHDEIMKKIPMKRAGTVEEIAHAVKFLVSDEASYITGQTIHVNGGAVMF